jgi:deoxyribonucleoside regulator
MACRRDGSAVRPAANEQEQDVQLRALSAEQRELIMIQAAKLYYDLERTMSEIAKELGLTRWQVGRILREARETGVVRIEIVPGVQRRPDLESRLQRAFGLREAIVVPHPSADDGIAVDRVAQAVGPFLAGLSPRPSLVGVSWGRTMTAVAHWLPRRWNDDVEVVLLNGAMNIRATATRTNNVAELFAQAGNGRATLLPVPAIVGRAGTREVLEQDPIIARVLELGAQATVACFSVGVVTPDSVLVQSGYLSEAEIARLRRRGAVGDILGRFIDAAGAVVDAQLDHRTIGLLPQALLSKPFAIGVCVGKAKHAAVLACLRARYINVLVTDEQTALFALEAAGDR